MTDFPNQRRFVTGLIFLVVLVLLVVLGVSSIGKIGVPKINPDTYQTVLLAGNQQYFGHLKNIKSKFPYMTDIYYVRSGSQGSNMQLIKLGGELHGPEDVMYLNWDNVVLWENLRPDSEVVKGIAQEKFQRANPSAVSPAPAPASAPASAAPAPVQQQPTQPTQSAPAVNAPAMQR